jgi:hypothetical protein
MKLLLTIAILFTSLSASAVRTKDCPDSLEVSLSNFENYEILDENGGYDNWNDPGIARVQDFLKNTAEVKVSAQLKYTPSGQCYYVGQNQDGEYATIRLEGTLKANAVQPATMTVYASDDLVTYHPIESLKKTELKIEAVPFYNTYYRGEYCDWGECVPDHINIGTVEVISVK